MDNFRDSYFNVTWDLTQKHLRGTFWGKQYDTGRGFAVTIVEGGKVTVPSTETVRLKWEKPDSTEGYVTAVVVDGKFIIENIDQMFTVHGAVRSDLEIWRGGKVISSITFYVNVEKAVAVDAIESSSEFTALQNAIATVDNITELNSSVASLDSEVIVARGTEPTLGARLDGIDAQLAEIMILPDVIKNTDISTVLQNAIDEAFLYGGGTVLLPEGNYALSKQVVIKANVRLEGRGDLTNLYCIQDCRTPFQLKSKAILKNIKLDGKVSNRLSELPYACPGIHIKNASNTLVEDVTFLDFGYYLPHELNGLVHDTINNNAQVITIELSEDHNDNVENNIIRNCRILDPVGRVSFAIRLWSPWVDSNNNIVKSQFNLRNNVIDNCYVVGTCKNAIELVGLTTVHNKVLNTTVYHSKGYGGIEADFGASYNLFENNTIEGYSPRQDVSSKYEFDAFRSTGSGQYNTPIYIYGNEFRNNKIKDINVNTTRYLTGVYLIRAIDCIIDELIIQNVNNADKERGVVLQETEDTVIKNSIFKDINVGVSVSGNSNHHNIMMLDNRFINNDYGVRSFKLSGDVVELLVLERNTFKNVKINSMRFTSEVGIKIDNNIFYGFEADTIFLNSAAEVTVQNNIFKNTKTELIRAFDASRRNSVYMGNACYNCFIQTSNNRMVASHNLTDSLTTTNNSVTMQLGYKPSSGDWKQGDYVVNTKPSILGQSVKFIIKGWVRVTNGSNHVLHEDWIEDKTVLS